MIQKESKKYSELIRSLEDKSLIIWLKTISLNIWILRFKTTPRGCFNWPWSIRIWSWPSKQPKIMTLRSFLDRSMIGRFYSVRHSLLNDASPLLIMKKKSSSLELFLETYRISTWINQETITFDSIQLFLLEISKKELRFQQRINKWHLLWLLPKFTICKISFRALAKLLRIKVSYPNWIIRDNTLLVAFL